MKKIVITGGHLTPALAVIEEIQKTHPDWEIIYFGRQFASEAEKTPSIEKEIIEQLGLTYLPITTGRLQRKFTRYTIPSLLKIPYGFVQSFKYLLKIKPNLILSFGGYLAVPVVYAGWLLKIPIITHEQTTIRGLANRLITPLASKIAVSWPINKKFYQPKKLILTGNPIRRDIFKVNQNIWSILNFNQSLPLLFITGGNQGSHLINQVVLSILPNLIKKFNIFHQCGYLENQADFDQLTNFKNHLPDNLQKQYHLKKYLNTQEMGTLLNKADLIISRAGANTCSELLALKKPCLLIPLEVGRFSEQLANTRLLKQTGLSEILLTKDLTADNLLKLINQMLVNLDRYRLKPKHQSLIKTTAAVKIVRLINET